MRAFLLMLCGLVVAPLSAQVNEESLRPGDVLRMRIYLEPDLSGEFPINEHGSATLPRLGDVPISTWPPDSIRPRLTRMYAEFLRDPIVEVTLLRRVAIYGSVLKPGLYPVDPTMTVQDALALAGGAAPDGKRNHVELLRGDKRIDTDLTLGSTVEQLRLRSGDQLFVPQRSWLSRNTWLVGSIIGATATIVAVVLR
jgi:protein involved in polysaccharide export with SLBB domain